MSGRKKGTLRVGSSGYQYDHWKGVFYPEELARDGWLGYYAKRFDTVEINNTYYGLPEARTFDAWREAVGPGFRYTLKFSRYGSHMKKLKDPAGTIGTFLERAEHLEAKLDAILVQLPPHWRAAPGRLAAFLAEAPTRHRWAVEFRDADWLREEVYAVLREHAAAMVIHDLIAEHPRVLAADWVYLRFHGPAASGDARYRYDYPPQALSAEARRIKDHLAAGPDVYAYFNNDAEGCAIANALDLRRYVLS